MPLARNPRTAAALLLAMVIVCAAIGCSGDARFQPDRLTLVSREVAPGHAEQIENILIELFGTPDEPRLWTDSEVSELLDLKKLEQAAGRVISHEEGVTLGLYRRHCARCHGVTGDGRGPTALYQHPYPRDFRRGVFKFSSTPRGVPPTDEDLHATLLRGAPGAAMPSFKLLKEEERDALVEYVKYLAIRGQLEQELIEFQGDELDYNPLTGKEGPGLSLKSPADRAFIVNQLLGDIVSRWSRADALVVEPPEPPPGFPDALVEQGRRLFADQQRLGCAKCHEADRIAEAAGQAADQAAGAVPIKGPIKDYDLWNWRRQEFRRESSALSNKISKQLNNSRQSSFAKGEVTAMLREQTARRQLVAEMLPPIAAEPRRLSEQALRGGAGPRDLFVHIQQGIDGTPMPSIAGVVSDEEVWGLVAYVLHVQTSEAQQAEPQVVETTP